MAISQPPYYHGTSKNSAESIIKNGIIESQLQSRDRGFLGEGFYVTDKKEIARRHATTVSSNNPVILKVHINNNAKILNAGETFTSGRLKPQNNPSWHDDFIRWSLGKVEDAAVWNYATDKSKETIISTAEKERTPESEYFDRLNWYTEVVEYAESNGYDIVYWVGGEIIIRNYNIVDSFEII